MTSHRQIIAALGLFIIAATTSCAHQPAEDGPAPNTPKPDFAAIKKQYDDSRLVICASHAAGLMDFLVENGTLKTEQDQDAFMEKAHEDCDYGANPKMALIAEIRYRVQLDAFLLTEDDQKIQKDYDTGLESIAKSTAEDLCFVAAREAYKVTSFVKEDAIRHCVLDPIAGARMYAQKAGFFGWLSTRPETTPAAQQVPESIAARP